MILTQKLRLKDLGTISFGDPTVKAGRVINLEDEVNFKIPLCSIQDGEFTKSELSDVDAPIKTSIQISRKTTQICHSHSTKRIPKGISFIVSEQVISNQFS